MALYDNFHYIPNNEKPSTNQRPRYSGVCSWTNALRETQWLCKKVGIQKQSRSRIILNKYGIWQPFSFQWNTMEYGNSLTPSPLTLHAVAAHEFTFVSGFHRHWILCSIWPILDIECSPSCCLSGLTVWNDHLSSPNYLSNNPQPASKSTESGAPQRNYIDYLAANSRDCRVYRHSRDCLFIWYDHIRSTRWCPSSYDWWILVDDVSWLPSSSYISTINPSWQTEQDELSSKTPPLSCPTPTATVVLSSPRTVFQPEYGGKKTHSFPWVNQKENSNCFVLQKNPTCILI